MISTLLFLVGAEIICTLTLIGGVSMPHQATKRNWHPIIVVGLFLVALCIIMIIPYYIIIVGLQNFSLGNDVVFGKLLGVYGDISANIWFTIGTMNINYTIFKAGTKLISIGAVLLVISKAIYDKIT